MVADARSRRPGGRAGLAAALRRPEPFLCQITETRTGDPDFSLPISGLSWPGPRSPFRFAVKSGDSARFRGGTLVGTTPCDSPLCLNFSSARSRRDSRPSSRSPPPSCGFAAPGARMPSARCAGALLAGSRSRRPPGICFSTRRSRRAGRRCSRRSPLGSPSISACRCGGAFGAAPTRPRASAPRGRSRSRAPRS